MTNVEARPLDAHEATATYDVMIVGAGFAGMYLLHKLRGLGFSARVYDAAGGVGGTWYWNRYPGARCDVMSIDYSFSFDPELEQEWEWSEKYATQPEILRYANHVADRYDLWPDMQFNTRIEAAHWNEGLGRWLVSTSAGDLVSVGHVVMAVGTLSAPKLPEIPGIETYQGATYQTQKWPHEGVDFTGKRVAVIGTGSSAIQSIPLIAAQAAHTTVFQRTPNYSMPAGNRPLDPAEVAKLKANYRDYRQRAKESFFGVPMEGEPKLCFEVSEDERQATYQAGWDSGNLVGLIGGFADILFNKEANDTAAEFIRNQIRSIVKDPETAEALCPKDYPVGTKRPCLDTHYYETFNKPNVRLVNLRQTPITEITPKGIKVGDEEIEVDAIVYATGFDAMTGSFTRVDIRGTGGAKLADEWANGPRTYLGLAMAGFPNFWAVTGPQSPSVLSNMMVSIEQHVDWITDCLVYLRDKGYHTIEARPEAQEAWVEHSNEIGNQTLYPLANSWYMGANVPGKPRVFLPYIGGCGPYRDKCDEVAAKGYEGFKLG
ncbi:MAG: NAD(P)/FAD-dependent oxidoreductase [Acidimicrobiia bacterium]|nr:NAD(P)/FAD-dependent oxidoreductase [Acidimicrobiia bacterium]MDH4365279.1 NAD(P)/FAD-dependent oxidoreductase [Acidimicrobiia bacterium]